MLQYMRTYPIQRTVYIVHLHVLVFKRKCSFYKIKKCKRSRVIVFPLNYMLPLFIKNNVICWYSYNILKLRVHSTQTRHTFRVKCVTLCYILEVNATQPCLLSYAIFIAQTTSSKLVVNGSKPFFPYTRVVLK